MAAIKTCRSCGREKPVDDYYVSGGSHKAQKDCKACFKLKVSENKLMRKEFGNTRRSKKVGEPGCCTKCGVWKPASDYWPRADRPGLRQSLCKECITIRRRRARQADPEKARATQRAEYRRNPDRLRGYAARRYCVKKTDPVWMQRNRDKTHDWYHKDIKVSRRRRRDDYAENTGRIRAYQALRRFRIKLGGLPFTGKVLREILRLQRGRCAICRKRISGPPSPDHIIPVCNGGTNDRRNIQATHLRCNQSKNGSDQILFMRSRFGRLL